MPTSSTRLTRSFGVKIASSAARNRTFCRVAIDVGHDDDQACMQWGRRIELPKIAGVVGDQHEVAVCRSAHDIPVFPAGLADPGDVLSFVPGFACDRDQIDAEALIDQKPHPASIAASFRRWRRMAFGAMPGLRTGTPARRIGGGVKWRQLHHFGGEARIGLA